MSPLTYWTKNPGDWSEKAFTLAEAFDLYEASLCSGCNQSSYFAHDPFNDGHFAVDDSTLCLGCAALDSYKDQDPFPGTKLFVTSDFD